MGKPRISNAATEVVIKIRVRDSKCHEERMQLTRLAHSFRDIVTEQTLFEFEMDSNARTW